MRAIYKGEPAIYESMFLHYGDIYDIVLDYSYLEYNVVVYIVEKGEIIFKIGYNTHWKDHWEVI